MKNYEKETKRMFLNSLDEYIVVFLQELFILTKN